MTFNAMAAVVDALKTHPEPVSLPEALEDANRMQLAEARSWLAQIAQVAGELRRLVDRMLAAQLAGGALRYGDQIMRPALRGRPKITDRGLWWDMVTEGVLKSDDPSALLAALYPADSLRLTALSQLADVLETSLEGLRDTMLEWEPPTATLDVMPISKAPKWAQKLEEGQFSGEKNNE